MKTDLSPQPPVPELWRALDDAARESAGTAFPRERIVQRGETFRRRRRLTMVTLSALLLVPLGIGLASLPAASGSDAVTGDAPRRTEASQPYESASSGPGVRVVRPRERIEAGLGVWYMLKPREMCDARAGAEQPVCVGPLDVQQPGTVPITQDWYPLERGVVHILAYTGKEPAARITMTEGGRTTDLPIVRLAGRPAYVTAYAVSAPRHGGAEGGLLTGGPTFRVLGADGTELARWGR
ncbi:hypothetical protein [Streptomyces griseorubiginosus]|uniref:hypothetical protein n=1 Tax=Streptomyces griseorubiginosus TaxID=67304 RepID=UPI001AD78661|nr:hypothetical protein [Streptomyces griseorubiginosus]MBO4253653.1 hypothetical protein [Streptomyces griseorubiginosus]